MRTRQHPGRPAGTETHRRAEKVGLGFTHEEAELLELYRRKHCIASRAECVRSAALREVKRDLGRDE